MQKTLKRRAPRSEYTSQSQLTFTGFETPFYNGLDPSNRWVVLSAQIPWDQLVNLFNKRNPAKSTGRPALNPRVLIGAVIIKHMLNLDDRETVAQITENMYPDERDRFSNIFWDTVSISNSHPLMPPCLWISENGSAMNCLPR
jgi:hypothetical protein